jgi:hypothetical protein
MKTGRLPLRKGHIGQPLSSDGKTPAAWPASKKLALEPLRHRTDSEHRKLMISPGESHE